MSTAEAVRADVAANLDARGKLSMILFRLAGAPELPRLLRAPFIVVYSILVGWVFGIELPVGTRVGPGLRLNHATGLVVNPGAIIGAYCDLKHGCTIGVRRSGGPSPVLGDHVVLGAGSHVIGGVTLSAGAETGAGAVVLQNIPADHIAVGNPARILARRGHNQLN